MNGPQNDLAALRPHPGEPDFLRGGKRRKDVLEEGRAVRVSLGGVAQEAVRDADRASRRLDGVDPVGLVGPRVAAPADLALERRDGGLGGRGGRAGLAPPRRVEVAEPEVRRPRLAGQDGRQQVYPRVCGGTIA